MLFFNFGIFAWKMGVAASVAPEGLGSQTPVKKLVHFIYLSDQLLSQNKVFTIFEPEPPPLKILKYSTDSGFLSNTRFTKNGRGSATPFWIDRNDLQIFKC